MLIGFSKAVAGVEAGARSARWAVPGMPSRHGSHLYVKGRQATCRQRVPKQRPRCLLQPFPAEPCCCCCWPPAGPGRQDLEGPREGGGGGPQSRDPAGAHVPEEWTLPAVARLPCFQLIFGKMGQSPCTALSAPGTCMGAWRPLRNLRWPIPPLLAPPPASSPNYVHGAAAACRTSKACCARTRKACCGHTKRSCLPAPQLCVCVCASVLAGRVRLWPGLSGHPGAPAAHPCQHHKCARQDAGGSGELSGTGVCCTCYAWAPAAPCILDRARSVRAWPRGRCTCRSRAGQ